MTSSAIDCDVISRTKAEWVRHGDDVERSSFLSSFMDSLCRVRNKIMDVLSWRTVSALTRVLFWYLFASLLRNSGNKHQNNPLVSAESNRLSSTYIILYDLIRHSTYGSYNIPDTHALSQVSTIGMEPPYAIQLQPLKSNRLQTCQFGLSNGQYRVTWDFQIAFGYAFIREVNFTTGICNNTGMCKVGNFHRAYKVMLCVLPVH